MDEKQKQAIQNFLAECGLTDDIENLKNNLLSENSANSFSFSSIQTYLDTAVTKIDNTEKGDEKCQQLIQVLVADNPLLSGIFNMLSSLDLSETGSQLFEENGQE